jgi:zinc transport system substrate-binding protein
MMKGFFAVLTALTLVPATLAGCGQAAASVSGTSANESGNARLSVVCTNFPSYDWTRQILGEKASAVELTVLMDNGVDIHSYQPSVADIAKISGSDLFIYVGGESDAWVTDVLAEAANPDMTVINLMEALGAGLKVEEIVEGMEDDEHGHQEEEEAHGGEEEAHGHEEEEEVFDEHVWMSLRNAGVFCETIAASLSALDPDNAGLYGENTAAYLSKLKALDEKYTQELSNASVRTLLFGDRFPFRYLMDDYDIDYYAAFPGCSAETEASFETIVFLADKLDELSLKYVMVTKTADQSIANTIIENAADKNREILVLDAIQSIETSAPLEGPTYLEIMENNLGVLNGAMA